MKLTVRTGPIVKSSSLRLSASSFNLETRGVFDQFCSEFFQKTENTLRTTKTEETGSNQKVLKVVSP